MSTNFFLYLSFCLFSLLVNSTTVQVCHNEAEIDEIEIFARGILYDLQRRYSFPSGEFLNISCTAGQDIFIPNGDTEELIVNYSLQRGYFYLFCKNQNNIFVRNIWIV
jgi:hypothetical protein